MRTYYVASLARYVLVEADSEDLARERGLVALRDLYEREQPGRQAPIEVLNIRPASHEEIELGRWHQEMVEREAQLG
jgi:hypothetical protein